MPADFDAKFGLAADEFQRYRPDYPPELFERIFAAVPSDRRERAMDLGAGTGKSTRALLSRFREVIAVEPDPGMAAKLREELPAAIVREITAELCPQPPSTVDLAVIGNALHWMESAPLFANVHSWLRKNGILAVFDRPLPKAAPAVDAVTLAELRGPWKPHRDPRLKRDLNWQDLVRGASGFRIVEEAKFSYIVPMSPQDYVGFWRSTSYGGAYARTLADPETYWRGLESRFREACGGGVISVDFSPTLILARKN